MIDPVIVTWEDIINETKKKHEKLKLAISIKFSPVTQGTFKILSHLAMLLFSLFWTIASLRFLWVVTENENRTI